MEFPHAFYGISVRSRCTHDPPGTPSQRRFIKLLLTDNPGECTRLVDEVAWSLPPRGLDLDWIEIKNPPQQPEGWMYNYNASSHLDIDYRVEAELTLQRVPRLIDRVPYVLLSISGAQHRRGCRLRWRGQASSLQDRPSQ